MSRPRKLALRLKTFVDTIYGAKYGYMTDLFIGGSFMMLSDAIAQKIKYQFCVDKEKFEYDTARIVHLGYFGSFTAFYQHFFYKWLDRRLPGTSKLTVVKKVCADEFVIAPISVSLFSTYNGFLETGDTAGAVANWKRLFFTAYTADLAYWSVFQTVNFYLVPPRYRITYISVVTVLWNTFLCFLDLYKRDEAHHEETKTVRAPPSSSVPLKMTLRDPTTLVLSTPLPVVTQAEEIGLGR